jgi:hypothetical protein
MADYKQMICKKHGMQIHRLRKDKDYYICKECVRVKSTLHKARQKAKCVEYLGGACVKCGYNICQAAMDFHHREDKEFTLSHRINYRWERLTKELDKCDLLCANCHRELHYNLNVVPT